MYQPIHFKEEDVVANHALIRDCPLGLLISAGTPGPIANAIPFLLNTEVKPFGVLRAHLARANQQWQDIDGKEVLVVFQSVDGYVTPSWYASKREHGKVVPTWNYAMVQARGIARIQDSTAWLEDQVGKLTNEHEVDRQQPWATTDAPSDYMKSQLRAIVGVEIVLTSLEGKMKVSQNRPEHDRLGVLEGLSKNDEHGAMAELVRRYGKLNT